MSRRPSTASKRVEDTASLPYASSSHHNSRTPPFLSVGLLGLGGFLLLGYFYGGFGRFSNDKEAFKGEGSCSIEVQRAIPFLKAAYGDSMRKVLHVGPDTCSTVSTLSKVEGTEVWGIEPYDLEDASIHCKSLVHKGIVRLADIKFPLPYKPKSFSLVIVSDALDYLSMKYLNKTLADLARLSRDGVVVFSGYPGQQRTKVSDLSKIESQLKAKLRSSFWWTRYFVQNKLEENEDASRKFEQAVGETSYIPSCQIFHLRSYD